MATLRKRGPYQWQAQIRRLGYPPQSKTFSSKAEAEAWAQMLESEMARGVWVSRGEAETTTLGELLDRYEKELVPAKKGQAQERSVIAAWRSTELARRPVAGVRGADLAEIRDEWLKDLMPATVLRRLSVLSHVFSIARKEWGMESLSNPVQLVRKPQPNNGRSRRLLAADNRLIRGANEGELERIVAASSSAVLPAIIRLAVETAMRRGEIVALRWEHIDLERQVAHLPDTKNGSSRDVPLSSRAVSSLQKMKEGAATTASEKGARSTRGGSEVDSSAGPVFHIRGDAVTRAFERTVQRARNTYIEECREAGRQPDPRFLCDLRFHDLRHEAASRLATIYQLHELTRVTGHKDPRMLMRYYHPRAEDLAKRLG